jgi:hypothetical protein
MNHAKGVYLTAGFLNKKTPTPVVRIVIGSPMSFAAKQKKTPTLL